MQRLSQIHGAFFIAPILVMMVAFGFVFLGRPGPVTDWFVAYWWVCLLSVIIVQMVGVIAASWLFRCPHCGFRPSLAAIQPFALRSTSRRIRFCAGCGKSLDGQPIEAQGGGLTHLPTLGLAKPLAGVAVVTLALLLMPAIAMQLTPEMNWGPGDFLVAGILLFAAGAAGVLVFRHVREAPHRIALWGAIGLALALVWAELAVGL